MEKIRQNHREQGSTLLLALVFLMVCLFVGGSALSAASANVGRLQPSYSQEEQNHRSGMLLLRDLTGTEEYTIQITIRDATVISASGSAKRTVSYLAVGENSLLHQLLLSWTVSSYEQSRGTPESRKVLWNGEPSSLPKQFAGDAGTLSMTLEFPVLQEKVVVEGDYAFSPAGELCISLGNLEMLLRSGRGEVTGNSLTAKGITTVTSSEVWFWEAPIIRKGVEDGRQNQSAGG